MKLPLNAVPQKQPFTKWIIKWAKYLRKTHKGAYIHPNGRHTACNFTGDEPSPHGIPQVYLIWIPIIGKTLECLLPKILFPIKVKILFTKFGIFTDKTLTINFEIKKKLINFKIC